MVQKQQKAIFDVYNIVKSLEKDKDLQIDIKDKICFLNEVVIKKSKQK